jgi:transcriptional regulator with XRE-family HTH domain
VPESSVIHKTSKKQPIVFVLKTKGITQRQLAMALAYSETYISLVHRSLARPSRRYREAAARYLAMPESLLFHEAGNGRDLAARDDADTTAPRLTPIQNEDPPRARGSYLEPVR